MDTALTNATSVLENNMFIVSGVLSAFCVIVFLNYLNLINHANLFTLYNRVSMYINSLVLRVEPYKPLIALVTFIFFIITFIGNIFQTYI